MDPITISSIVSGVGNLLPGLSGTTAQLAENQLAAQEQQRRWLFGGLIFGGLIVVALVLSQRR